MCTLHMNKLQQNKFSRTHKDKNVSIFHIVYIVTVQVVIFTSQVDILLILIGYLNPVDLSVEAACLVSNNLIDFNMRR